MDKTQTIEAIRKHNHSAREEFLVHFDEQTLEDYLRRLDLTDHRGPRSVWVRERDARCVATRTA